MYYLVGEHANVDRRIVTEEHPTVQMHIKEDIELGVTPRTPERIIKWMWGIKKKSENLYDLIEVGDLIRYDDEFLGAFPLREVYLEYGELQLLDGTGIKFLNITAIYKPNSKGDYIKVWERGE